MHAKNALLQGNVIRIHPGMHSTTGKATKAQRLLIGSNPVRINGWVGSQAIDGKAVKLEYIRSIFGGE